MKTIRKQNKTICLNPSVISKGEKAAEKLGISFSAYVELLINDK